MNTAPTASRHRAILSRLLELLFLCLAALLVAPLPSALGQDLTRGSFYWYAPEHETFSKTQFYSQPRFDTAQVRIPRTQRFRIVAGGKGWFMLEFDVAGKAYIHMRLLRNMVYDPGAQDPWYEFKRASVFAEEPAKIEARLKAAATPDPPTQSKQSSVPSWKRYKESWNLKGPRSAPPAADTADASSAGVSPRPPEKKLRNKYPMLPPIGSDPARAEDDKAAPAEDPAATAP